MSEGRIVRGIILRGEDDELVVRASPAEVDAFARRGWGGAVVSGTERAPSVWMQPAAEVRPNDLLYDVTVRPVARITEMSISADRRDMTELGSVIQRWAQGLVQVDIRAVGV